MEYLVFRASCAILVGVILSQTGSLMQMSTRNILASPSTLGFDGLSILWILLFHSLLLLFGSDLAFVYLLLGGLPLFVFIGWVYSRFIGHHKNIERLILIGLTFNLLVGAIFSLWQFLFLAFNLPFPVELWFGHFRFANRDALIILVILETCFLVGSILLKKQFIIFSLGKSISANMKLNHDHFYKFLFVSVAVGTFAVVTMFGAFSFLGLIFPILSRKLWFGKYDLQGEFFLGGLMNGVFLMLIDLLCYFFPFYGAEVPVGLIATSIGAVSLIFLLWKPDGPLEILAKQKK